MKLDRIAMVRMTDEMYEKLMERSEREKKPLSEIIRDLLWRHLGGKPDDR